MKSLYRFLFLVCLSYCTVSCFAADSSAVSYAHKGILDLRSYNFKEKNIVPQGEWGFYWHQLLTPDSLPSAKPLYTVFPALWNNTKINGKQLPAQGYATYALTILLPAKRDPLALKIEDFYSSYRLFVNGVLFAENGNPSTNAETTVPAFEQITRKLPVETDTLKLVLQVANFTHSKGGFNRKIYLGDNAKLSADREKELASNFLLAGCIFICGLFFFGLYLFGQQDKVILYFSLFSVLYSYRVIGSPPYLLNSVFPSIPYWFTMHADYISLYLCVCFFVLYIRYLYPEDTHKKLTRIMTAISLLFLFTVICTPISFFTTLLAPFLVIILLYMVYIFYVFIIAAKNKRKGSVYSLIGIAISLSVFTVLDLNYFGIIPSPDAWILSGYLLFFILQSLILTFRFADNLKVARQKAEDASLAKSQFLSTMSHEIRTPLNAVIGLTHLMLKNEPRKDQEDELKIMLFSANNLLSIVNDILDFNKIEAGKIHFECIETNVHDIIKNIAGGFKTYADEKGINLIVEPDKSLDVTVLADPTRTSQVLTNLVHNAIKFTSKGSVTISCKVEERNNSVISILFSVKDTGIGIPPEKQRIIFDQFTQADSSTSRSFGGTGLGLSICKSILEKQGCRMQLQSEENKGTEFFFVQSFPVCKKIEAVIKPVTVDNNKPFLGIHILLVEDSEFNIIVATRFLQAWGAEIDVAQNGQEAIDKFDEEKHKLILMDLHMPVMDGRDATIQLRKQGAKVPIIALTASIYADENKKVIACGANDIVVKPFEPESFRNKLMQYLKTAS
ncbi:ATP-binding protein [Panacibacter ginsenosidivorans]|uniref:ATP-binding protein n=1 Tax=Panacibacter ginsenosidivorans TaxID=1813871 RepID=UPI0013152CD8|nr:ATP-binding protein [Panacibacter ginsenosidivorans]